MNFQQQRGSKSRSSSHRGGGQERRERRREEIRSQLYPTTAEDQRGEPHLLYRRHHRTSGIDGSRPAYSEDGDHFRDYRNGFSQEPMNSKATHPASFPQGAVSGTPFHDIPASYTEQLQPLITPSHGQEQLLLQPTKPVSSSTVEASKVQSDPTKPTALLNMVKTTEAIGDGAEVKKEPPALQEKTNGVKQVEDGSVSMESQNIESSSKPHPQASVEKPLQERKEEVTEIEEEDKRGVHTEPQDEESTKAHPPVTKTEASMEPTSSLPSKSDLNIEAESLASVVPSSKQISDPFALPSSSSLPKLPPLKKSLPPLLPPIGATVTTAAAGQSVKELGSTASSNKQEVKGDKESSDKEGGSSSASVAATHRGGIEDGSDGKREMKVEKEGFDKGGGSSATSVAAAFTGGESGDTPGIGKGSSTGQVHDSSVQKKGGGESSSGGTTENQEQETKDSSSATTSKLNGNGSQKQEKSRKSNQSVASPVEKEKVNDKEMENHKDERQTDHLDRGSGEDDSVKEEKAGGKGEEGKAAEGERKGKATVSPPTSVVTPPPKQPRNLKVGQFG